MEMEENWLMWCRLCAKIQTKPHIQIFFKNEEKRDLPKILEQNYLLEISEEDKLPKTICETCFSSIQNHLDFVKIVRKTQEMYSDLLSWGYTNKAELLQIRRRYNIDKTEGSTDESDTKVGFIDVCPFVDCDVVIQNENIKNPLDEPALSNDKSFFDDHFNKETNNDEGTKEKDFAMLDLDQIKIDSPDPDPEFEEEKKDILADKPAESVTTPSTSPRRKCTKKKEINYLENKDDDDDDYEGDADEARDADNDDFEYGVFDEDMEFLDLDKSEEEEEIKSQSTKKRKIRKDKIVVQYECPDCPYKNFRKGDMKWHMIKKHNKPVDKNHKYICNQCSKVFRNEHFLQRHKKSHLPEDQKRTWPCPHCDKRFSSNNNAKIHIKHIHLNQNQYICEVCGFIAKTTGSLKQHMESHEPIGRFICSVCGVRIKSSYRLKVHMDTHNPEKFPCHICNLKFSSRLTLKNHVVLHSDALPFKCDCCGRGFKLSKYLKSHLLTHTGLKNYTCNFCERQFAHSANCRLHMKREHPTELSKLDAEGGPKRRTGVVPSLQALRAFAKSVPNGTAENEAPMFL